MIVNREETLELSLKGDGMKPTKLKASEVAELISAYENALLRVIERNNPEINLDKVTISLVDVQENSSHFLFLSNVKPAVFAAASAINVAITSETTSKLPFKAVESLNEIWKFTRKKGCATTFSGPGMSSAVIVPTKPIEITKEFFFESETTIYGMIERVGGAEPKVRIRLDDDQILYLSIDEAKAKRLAGRLYESIALKGMAKWRKDDHRLEDFTIEEILHFDEGTIVTSLKELGNTIGTHWDKIRDTDGFLLNSRYEKEDY